MRVFIKRIREEKCPVCGIDKVFETKGNVFLFKIPRMKEACSSCGTKFEKEPGYFTGAMYVSYGLCIIEMVAALLLIQLTNIPASYHFYFLTLTVLVLWTFNFRMSRVIWMHLI